jgi:hypothetical protein
LTNEPGIEENDEIEGLMDVLTQVDCEKADEKGGAAASSGISQG